MEYLVCFSVSSLMLNMSSKKFNKLWGKLFFVLAVSLPILMATFRSVDVGIDVKVYVQPCTRWAINSDSFVSYITLALSNGIEIGYALLTYFGANYLGGISGVFFLSAILIILPIYIRLLDYKEEIPVLISSLIYLLVFYNLSLNITRQSMALSILFFAFKYVEEKRYKKFVLFLSIAFLFHSSAILAIVYPILSVLSKGKDWRTKQILIVTILILFVSFYNKIFEFFIGLLFPENIDRYVKAFLQDDTGYISFWMIVINVFIVLCVLVSKQYLMKTNRYKLYILLALFNLILYTLTGYNGNCFRYSLYFMIMVPKIVPLVRYKISKNSRVLADMLIVAVFLLFWFNFNILTDSYGTIPYSLM